MSYPIKYCKLRLYSLDIYLTRFKNTKKWHFWSHIYAFSFLHKILQLDKFEGAGFKYDNSFLKF